MNKSPLLKYVSLKTYIIGFVLSLTLTLMAFGAVKLHEMLGRSLETHPFVIPVILVFALIQLAVQLIFFLHLVKEDKPRWNLFFFISTFGLILMIVIASVWILNNLNYNMMPMETTEFIIHDEGIKVDKGL